MQEKNEKNEPMCSLADEAEMSEAEIDETLAETFPASDPPSWTLGTDHRQTEDQRD